MAKIVESYETKYDKGDWVIFVKDNKTEVGVITNFSIDHSAGDSIWYDIMVSPGKVHNFVTDGDVPEWDIVQKMEANEHLKHLITGVKEDKDDR